MAKKGPAYLDCNERQSNCTRRTAQPTLGCPNCEYTIQYKLFRKELEAELSKLRRGTWKGYQRWPSQELLRIVTEIAATNGRVGESEINPDWPVPILILVSVYRDEWAKKKTIDNHILSQSARTPDNSDDEGDFD